MGLQDPSPFPRCPSASHGRCSVHHTSTSACRSLSRGSTQWTLPQQNWLATCLPQTLPRTLLKSPGCRAPPSFQSSLPSLSFRSQCLENALGLAAGGWRPLESTGRSKGNAGAKVFLACFFLNSDSGGISLPSFYPNRASRNLLYWLCQPRWWKQLPTAAGLS